MPPLTGHRTFALALLFLLSLQSCGRAHAQQPAPPAAAPAADQPFVIEQLVTRYRFEDDGSGARVESVAVLIREQAAVEHWGTLVFPYMGAIESVSIRQLVVEKPDGRRIEAKEGRSRT